MHAHALPEAECLIATVTHAILRMAATGGWNLWWGR